MTFTREQLHEIGKAKLEKYDDWKAKDPEKLSLKKLKEAVEWWRNEIKEDYKRLDQIPKEELVTYVAGFNNLTVTGLLFSLVEGHYIKKLENEISKHNTKKKIF